MIARFLPISTCVVAAIGASSDYECEPEARGQKLQPEDYAPCVWAGDGLLLQDSKNPPKQRDAKTQLRATLGEGRGATRRCINVGAKSHSIGITNLGDCGCS